MADATVEARKTKTVYTPVTMEDGTTAQFPGDQKILTEISADNQSVKLLFRNGKVLNISTSHGGHKERFAVHGVIQKHRDEAAGEKDVDDAYEAIIALNSRLATGEWSIKREGSGFAGQSVLVQALAKAFSKSLDEVRSILKDMTQKEKMIMRAAPEVAPFVREIEEKKAKDSGVDSAALVNRFKTA